jgi:hypothetical protein
LKIVSTPETILTLSERKSSAEYEIFFEANLPPLSLVTFLMQRVSQPNKPYSK